MGPVLENRQGWWNLPPLGTRAATAAEGTIAPPFSPTSNSALLLQTRAANLTNRLSLPKEAVCTSIPPSPSLTPSRTPPPPHPAPLQPLELLARRSIGGNSGGPVGSRGSGSMVRVERMFVAGTGLVCSCRAFLKKFGWGQ